MELRSFQIYSDLRKKVWRPFAGTGRLTWAINNASKNMKKRISDTDNLNLAGIRRVFQS